MPYRKPMLRTPFRPLYDEARLPSNIRRSAMFVILANMCGNLWGTISTGSALAGFAGLLGSNDFVFGLLTAIPLFGSLTQIPAAVHVSRTRQRKRYLLSFGVISRGMWILIGLVPLLIPSAPPWMRIWTVIAMSGISALAGSYINVCFTPWLADLIPPQIRGRWLTARDRIFAITNVLMGLGVAWVLDHLAGFSGYILVFVVIGILGVLDMFFFIPVTEMPMQTSPDTSLKSVWKSFFADRGFVRFLLFWTLWSFTSNLSAPFFMRYALGPMQLSFMTTTLASQITAASVSVLTLAMWGRVMDRYGNKNTLYISGLITAFTPAIWLFCTPGAWWPVFLFHLIGAAFWNAANLAAVNMLMDNSPAENRPSYIAIFSAFTSIVGSFLGVLLGGSLLQGLSDWIARDGIRIWGWVPDHYKIVFTLGVLTRVAVVLIFVPKMHDDSRRTLGDMKKLLMRQLRR